MDLLIIFWLAVGVMGCTVAAIPFWVDWKEKRRKILKKANKKAKQQRRAQAALG